MLPPEKKWVVFRNYENGNMVDCLMNSVASHSRIFRSSEKYVDIFGRAEYSGLGDFGKTKKRVPENNITKRRFGMFPNLRAEMARKGWTLVKLAQETGIPVSTLHDRLFGKTKLTLENAVAIKQALGLDLSLDYLFAEAE